jgi:hypothetical protein
VVQCPPSKHEALSSNPHTIRKKKEILKKYFLMFPTQMMNAWDDRYDSYPDLLAAHFKQY